MITNSEQFPTYKSLSPVQRTQTRSGQKNDLEKIGYKKFFNWMSRNKRSLTKDTIDQHISDYKKQHNLG